MLPTLDQFLAAFPNNGYIKYPGFKSLYIRKNQLIVRIGDDIFHCEGVIHLANLTAKKPGTGALKALVADLLSRGKAIYVENVHEPWFQEKLLERGFIRVDESKGHHYLFNHVGHLTFIESCLPASSTH